MDCRANVILALCLALSVGAAGCQTTTTTVATGPSAHPPAGATVVARDNTPKKPKADTLVSLAKVRMGQADGDPKPSIEEQVKLRDQARQYLQDAIKLDSNCIAAHRGLVQVYLKLKDIDRAVETLHTALKTHEKNSSLWADLAMCHNCRKEYDQAVQCLNKAIEIEPENRQFALALGLTLARAGRLEPSVAVLTKAYSADHAHYTVGRMLYQMNQDDACKEHLRQVLAVNPNHEGALQLLAVLERNNTISAPVSAAVARPSADPQPTVRTSSE